jgi:hypothetical protein
MTLGNYPCPLCGHKVKDGGRMFLKCHVKGYERPPFVCGKCLLEDKRVLGRVRSV